MSLHRFLQSSQNKPDSQNSANFVILSDSADWQNWPRFRLLRFLHIQIMPRQRVPVYTNMHRLQISSYTDNNKTQSLGNKYHERKHKTLFNKVPANKNWLNCRYGSTVLKLKWYKYFLFRTLPIPLVLACLIPSPALTDLAMTQFSWDF